MNIRFLPCGARATTLLAVLFCIATARASTPLAEPSTLAIVQNSIGLQRISDPQGERLAQVYHILASCDRDYDGHVPKAMKEVEFAAKLLGVDVHGDGIVDKKQGDSEEHLHTAQEMLRIAHSGLPVTGEKKALVNVGAALREVTAALNKK